MFPRLFDTCTMVSCINTLIWKKSEHHREKRLKWIARVVPPLLTHILTPAHFQHRLDQVLNKLITQE